MASRAKVIEQALLEQVVEDRREDVGQDDVEAALAGIRERADLQVDGRGDTVAVEVLLGGPDCARVVVEREDRTRAEQGGGDCEDA